MKDHPRSRGVYSPISGTHSSSRGSSPLARGLPRSPAGRPGLDRDHPRSRGVYRRSSGRHCLRSGSSPLARGLPPEGAAALPVYGIIPARAGFTTSVKARSLRSRDHPRSRGVYSFRCDLKSGMEGSSPLARGLLSPLLSFATKTRIIPARAGFTRTSGMRRRARTGSSPLARGLPNIPLEGVGMFGIIPARAGFTQTCTASPLSTWDHPRSRGVYSICNHVRGLSSGSSPLARGLRRENGLRTASFRIIPARAGFTTAKRRSPA